MIYDYAFTDIKGEKVALSTFKGKTLLLVNTASKCGFTYQYEGLESLWKEYKDKGLVVIGFPCNQFKDQEPEGNEAIAEFCKLNYGVTFPLSQKIDVRGENADPIFKCLTDNTTFKGFTGEKAEFMTNFIKELYQDKANDSSVKWNFTKFLINGEGEIVGRFEPTVNPDEIKAEIEKCL